MSRGVAAGLGQDLDDAVLAATSNQINANQLSQSLRLTFACKNLPNMDTFTRTDGMLVLHEKRGNMWQMVGMTEIIMDNLSPEWVKDFVVPYKFEEVQLFKAVVYDVDDFENLRLLQKHSMVGELEFTLHEVATARDQLLQKPFVDGKKDALMEIAGEEIKLNGSNDQVIMVPKVSFKNNMNRGEMLFFLVYKCHSGVGSRAVWKPLYKSEIKTNDNSVRSSADFTFN